MGFSQLSAIVVTGHLKISVKTYYKALCLTQKTLPFIHRHLELVLYRQPAGPIHQNGPQKPFAACDFAR